MLELFCGTAGVSAALKQHGIDAVPIDKIISKSPKAMIVKLDLTQYSTQQLVPDWIRMPQVVGIFLAPPCGTASKARTIVLEGETNLPQPLRTPEQPDGVDDLSGADFERVQQSNILYDFSAECCDLCVELNKFFACENPKDSLYWDTTSWQERKYKHLDLEQIHQACAYGSERPKWTKLSANFPEILDINKVCPGNHFHRPWGVQRHNGKRIFATALEVHYPVQLCQAISNAFLQALQRKNVFPMQMP